jgi:hypothetical protein
VASAIVQSTPRKTSEGIKKITGFEVDRADGNNAINSAIFPAPPALRFELFKASRKGSQVSGSSALFLIAGDKYKPVRCFAKRNVARCWSIS